MCLKMKRKEWIINMRPRKYPYSKKQVQYRTVKRSLGLGKGIIIERVIEDSSPPSPRTLSLEPQEWCGEVLRSTP